MAKHLVHMLFVVCFVMIAEAAPAEDIFSYDFEATKILEPNTIDSLEYTFSGDHNSTVIYYNNEVLNPDQFVVSRSENETNVVLERLISYDTAGKYQFANSYTFYRAVVSPLTCVRKIRHRMIKPFSITRTMICTLTASYDPESEYFLNWNIVEDTDITTANKINNKMIEFTRKFPKHYRDVSVSIDYRGASTSRSWTFIPKPTPTYDMKGMVLVYILIAFMLIVCVLSGFEK